MDNNYLLPKELKNNEKVMVYKAIAYGKYEEIGEGIVAGVCCSCMAMFGGGIATIKLNNGSTLNCDYLDGYVFKRTLD